MSYSWYFKADKENQEDSAKIFAVKDFIGDLCNVMASKVRSAVASVDFDSFHKTSARLIRKSIFGLDDQQKIRKEFLLAKNNLVVTNVDIQSVEPVDDNTKENLQKTVTLAIEITTKRQEAHARHNAEKLDQEAKGELQKLIIEDQSKAETAKKGLLELQAKSEAVQNQGVAIAHAKAKAEADEIRAKSALRNAELQAKARDIEYEATLSREIKKRHVLLEHETKISMLEIERTKKLAEIEAKKFLKL